MDDSIKDRIKNFDFRGKSSVFIHLSLIYVVAQTLEIDDSEENIVIGGKNYIYSCLAFNFNVFGALLKKYSKFGKKINVFNIEIASIFASFEVY